MTNVLITSIGGGGSMSLVNTIKGFDPDGDFKFVGTHYDPYELIKAWADGLHDIYRVPRAADREAYLDAHMKIIEKHDIDLLIANSDYEVGAWVDVLDDIPCRHLIPPARIVKAVQDKYSFQQILEKHGCAVVPNVAVKSREHLPEALVALPHEGRFWVRPRTGSGSFGATWAESLSQAEKWIDLCVEMRGLSYSDFILAPFLPGRDFMVTTMWQNGEFAIGKVVERLRYFFAGNALHGMGSTPSVSRPVNEPRAVEAVKKAIVAIYEEFGEKPHGHFNCDIKCAEDGSPFITEMNIGRFPAISAQFDRVGEFNLLQQYIQLAMVDGFQLPRDVLDYAPGKVIVRATDRPITFAEAADVEALSDRWIENT